MHSTTCSSMLDDKQILHLAYLLDLHKPFCCQLNHSVQLSDHISEAWCILTSYVCLTWKGAWHALFSIFSDDLLNLHRRERIYSYYLQVVVLSKDSLSGRGYDCQLSNFIYHIVDVNSRELDLIFFWGMNYYIWSP